MPEEKDSSSTHLAPKFQALQGAGETLGCYRDEDLGTQKEF